MSQNLKNRPGIFESIVFMAIAAIAMSFLFVFALDEGVNAIVSKLSDNHNQDILALILMVVFLVVCFFIWLIGG